MSDPSLPLTEHEYEEWGNFSTDARVREYIQGWCPVSNVRVQDYPAMLVTTSLDDEHVSWTHAAKWVDSVQRLNTSNNPILLRVDHDGTGHYGSGGRYQRYDAMAYSNSFLLGVLDEL
jgi:oligopeptidase B